MNNSINTTSTNNNTDYLSVLSKLTELDWNKLSTLANILQTIPNTANTNNNNNTNTDQLLSPSNDPTNDTRALLVSPNININTNNTNSNTNNNHPVLSPLSMLNSSSRDRVDRSECILPQPLSAAIESTTNSNNNSNKALVNELQQRINELEIERAQLRQLIAKSNNSNPIINHSASNPHLLRYDSVTTTPRTSVSQVHPPTINQSTAESTLYSKRRTRTASVELQQFEQHIQQAAESQSQQQLQKSKSSALSASAPSIIAKSPLSTDNNDSTSNTDSNNQLLQQQSNNSKASFRLLKADNRNCSYCLIGSEGITLGVRSTNLVRLKWIQPPTTVLIIKKPGDELIARALVEVAEYLHNKGLIVMVEPVVKSEKLGNICNYNYLQTWSSECSLQHLHRQIDFIVCLGGDGSLLWVSQLFKTAVPPVISFGLGSLGFLSPFPFNSFKQSIDLVLNGAFHLSLRSRIVCTIVRENQNGNGTTAAATGTSTGINNNNPSTAAATALPTEIHNVNTQSTAKLTNTTSTHISNSNRSTATAPTAVPTTATASSGSKSPLISSKRHSSFQPISPRSTGIAVSTAPGTGTRNNQLESLQLGAAAASNKSTNSNNSSSNSSSRIPRRFLSNPSTNQHPHHRSVSSSAAQKSIHSHMSMSLQGAMKFPFVNQPAAVTAESTTPTTATEIPTTPPAMDVCAPIDTDSDLDCDDRAASASNSFICMNEVIVDRGLSSYLTNLDCFVDGMLFTKVQADGIIVGTPTGSTAYSLSAGGSMVHPDVSTFLFTPVCPHSLSFRPMMFPDTCTLQIQVSGDSRSANSASFDGRNRQILNPGDSLLISMSRYPIPAVCKLDQTADWFSSVRGVLNWNSRTATQKGFKSHTTESTKIQSASAANDPNDYQSDSQSEHGSNL